MPTVDTVRYEYILRTLIAHEYPAMLVGPVGTGAFAPDLLIVAFVVRGNCLQEPRVRLCDEIGIFMSSFELAKTDGSLRN